MGYFMFFSILVSIAASIFNGKIDELSISLLSESANAVTLIISLCGSLCFWSGIMNVAEKSGIVNKISKIIYPIISLLFPSLDKNGKACGYIVLNFISNLLGLGNASTPLGLKAMEELEKSNADKGCASDSMIMLVIINTASLQLFPATVAAIRTQYGSASPAEIVPCVWIVSIFSFTLSVTIAKIMALHNKRKTAGNELH